jgi:hypothetical protein
MEVKIQEFKSLGSIERINAFDGRQRLGMSGKMPEKLGYREKDGGVVFFDGLVFFDAEDAGIKWLVK